MLPSLILRIRTKAPAPLHSIAFVALAALAGCAEPAPTKRAESVPPQREAVAVAPVSLTLTPSAPLVPQAWQPLFDGKTLNGWRETPFAGHGGANVENGALVMNAGAALSGVNYTNAMPQMNYEISLEARRVEGSDFFCGITFPVGDTFCSFIVGGWGCCVVGLSNINGEDASSNETSSNLAFEKGRWYKIRLRVTPAKIETWIDDKQVVDLETADKKIALRYGEIEFSKPFGLATWVTTAAWRDIRLRVLASPNRQ